MSTDLGVDRAVAADRLEVRKTAKLFIGGAFVRSESGRTEPVPVAGAVRNLPVASRKDARDAVVAARTGFIRWSAATPYLRGQVLYRAAEMLEARVGELAGLLVGSGAVDNLPAAVAEAAEAVDLLVHYAGWTDKIASVVGSVNAVSAPFLSVSTPVPSGVVAALTPGAPALLGVLAALAPPLAAGCSVVAVVPPAAACVALELAEVLATSDLPAGAVNLLTGFRAEVAATLAGHGDVNVVDLTGAEPAVAAELEASAAGTLKRVVRPGAAAVSPAEPLARLRAMVELRTVWHPAGR